jgi:GR25 family glycosyltransferase involved in LPS biosynthesis
MIDRGEQEEDDVTLEKGAEEAVAQRIPKLPVGPKRCLIALL